MLEESYVSVPQRVLSGIFFFVYLGFAIFIFLSSLSLAKPNLPSLLEIPFVADIYLAGAIDIVLALVAGAVIHARFHGKIDSFVRERMPILFLLKLPFMLVGAIGFGLITIWVIFLEFSNMSLLFFFLLLIYFLKNFLFVMLGKSKEIILERFAKTYNYGIYAAILGAALSFLLIPATGFNPKAILPMLNGVSIYYVAMAFANGKKAFQKQT